MGGTIDYQELFEHAPDAVLVISPNGAVLDANRRACAFLGYARSALVGSDVSSLIAPDPRRADEEAPPGVRDLIADEPARRLFVRGDGGRVAGEIAGTSVPARAGEGEVIVAVVRDVSERVPAARDRAEVTKRLEALGSLAGGIAHDFNNILASIIGFAELAREQMPADSEAARDLDRALKASGQASKLVGQILAFGKRGSNDRRPVDVEQAIVGIVRLARATLPPTAELRIASDHSHTVVSGDETRLQQVVLNLCANAGKALGPRGGEVRVTVETVELDAHDWGLSPGRYVALSVEDDGPGVPEEMRDWIFEPYVSTRSASGGTGLGLSVVKNIVESCGGAIRLIDSERGAHFRVLLPATAGSVADGGEPADAPGEGRGTVLLLDDTPDLVEIATRRLSAAGYTVMASDEVYDALQLVNAWGEEIDLVVTDYSMPAMTGTEFLRRAREAGLKAPALVATGMDPVIPDGLRRALGIVDIVRKPLAGDDLVRLVDRFVGPGEA